MTHTSIYSDKAREIDTKGLSELESYVFMIERENKAIRLSLENIADYAEKLKRLADKQRQSFKD